MANDHYTPMTFPVSFAVQAAAIVGARYAIGTLKKGDIVRTVEAMFPDLQLVGYIAAQGSTDPLLVGEIADGGWGWFRPYVSFDPLPADTVLEFVISEVISPVAASTAVKGVVTIDRMATETNDFVPLPVPTPVPVPNEEGIIDQLYSEEMQGAHDPNNTTFQDGIRHINADMKADIFTRKLVDKKYGNVLSDKPIFISRLFKRDRIIGMQVGLLNKGIPADGLAISIGTLSDPAKYFSGRVMSPEDSFFAEIKIRKSMSSQVPDEMIEVYAYLADATALAAADPTETLFGRITYVRN